MHRQRWFTFPLFVLCHCLPITNSNCTSCQVGPNWRPFTRYEWNREHVLKSCYFILATSWHIRIGQYIFTLCVHRIWYRRFNIWSRSMFPDLCFRHLVHICLKSYTHTKDVHNTPVLNDIANTFCQIFVFFSFACALIERQHQISKRMPTLTICQQWRISDYRNMASSCWMNSRKKKKKAKVLVYRINNAFRFTCERTNCAAINYHFLLQTVENNNHIPYEMRQLSGIFCFCFCFLLAHFHIYKL